MLELGYSQVGPGYYMKLSQRGDWMVGRAVCFPAEGGIVRIERAYPLQEAQIEAVAKIVEGDPSLELIGFDLVGGDDYDDYDDDDDDEVGARGRRRRQARRSQRRQKRGVNRRVLKKMGKKFRRRVNNAAKQIAKTKIIKQINKAKAKVLQSPIAGAGVAAAARALSAFGVPASVTKLALNQARFAAADRAEQGGAAAMVARFSEGEITDRAHRQKVMKEIAKRRKKALLEGVKSSIPGGNLLKAGMGVATESGVLKGQGGDFGALAQQGLQASGRIQSTGYDPYDYIE
jgi:hypothetical protein